MTTSPPEREGPVASPPFVLRPETEADASFRLALFRVSRGSAWDQLPLPPGVVNQIMEQQFHFQTQGYRTTFPQARLEIVTVDEVPVGRLATDRDARSVHLVDIALTPEWRDRGIGGAILRGLMDEATAAGTSVTLQVARDNPDAQRLYHRLGFALTGANDTHLTLTWTPTPAEIA